MKIIETLSRGVDVTFAVFYFIYKVVTNKFFYIPALIISLLFSVNYFFDNYRLRTPILVAFQSPVEARYEHEILSPVAEAVGGIEEEVAEELVEESTALGVAEPIGLATFEGKASWYGATLDQCVGCGAHYDENGNLFFRTANGEVFDENDLTLAFNDLPLNTIVRVTNLDTGDRVFARVTDTGGFEKYGRIADLSKGLAEAINLQTDVSTIRIEEVPVLE